MHWPFQVFVPGEELQESVRGDRAEEVTIRAHVCGRSLLQVLRGVGGGGGQEGDQVVHGGLVRGPLMLGIPLHQGGGVQGWQRASGHGPEEAQRSQHVVVSCEGLNRGVSLVVGDRQQELAISGTPSHCRRRPSVGWANRCGLLGGRLGSKGVVLGGHAC